MPKIAHPVNYLAHRKNRGTMIITNMQFRPEFLQNQLTPGWKPHSSTRRTAVLSRNWSSNITLTHSWSLRLLFMKSHCVLATDSTEFKGRWFSKFPGKTHYLGLECSNLKAAHPVNWIFWAKILRIAHAIHCMHFFETR